MHVQCRVWIIVGCKPAIWELNFSDWSMFYSTIQNYPKLLPYEGFSPVVQNSGFLTLTPSDTALQHSTHLGRNFALYTIPFLHNHTSPFATFSSYLTDIPCEHVIKDLIQCRYVQVPLTLMQCATWTLLSFCATYDIFLTQSLCL